MVTLFSTFWAFCMAGKRELVLENLALRQQLGVCFGKKEATEAKDF